MTRLQAAFQYLDAASQVRNGASAETDAARIQAATFLASIGCGAEQVEDEIERIHNPPAEAG